MASKLKLQPNPTFRIFASIHIPGQLEKETVAFEVKALSESALSSGENDETTVEFCRRVVTDWDIDAPFTQENLTLLLDNYPSAPRAILNAYLKELYGEAEKN